MYDDEHKGISSKTLDMRMGRGMGEENYSLQSISLNIFMFAFAMLLLLSYLILPVPLPIHSPSKHPQAHTHNGASRFRRRMFSTYNDVLENNFFISSSCWEEDADWRWRRKGKRLEP